MSFFVENFQPEKFLSQSVDVAPPFKPEGTLIIVHNYDEPGKIGGVGTVLGSHGINIRYMQVASLDAEARQSPSTPLSQQKDNEALMILGVDGEVSAQIMDGLKASKGVLDVSLVQL
ncbi:hypothetical protein E4U47_001507 [Claviceps purpurea]|nr:hypothetical protein E4U47_001507 [Claviceps purpurea]